MKHGLHWRMHAGAVGEPCLARKRLQLSTRCTVALALGCTLRHAHARHSAALARVPPTLLQELRGRWVVEPCGMASMLRYDVTVVPKQAIPFTLVNHVVRAGLPANILAVTQRAEQVGSAPA